MTKTPSAAEVEHRAIGFNLGEGAFPLIDMQRVMDHALVQHAAAKAAVAKRERRVGSHMATSD